VVSVLTIPKIIVAQQNQANNAKAREVASMIAIALQQMRMSNQLTANTRTDDLTPFLNSVERQLPTAFLSGWIPMETTVAQPTGPAGRFHFFCITTEKLPPRAMRSPIPLGDADMSQARYRPEIRRGLNGRGRYF
jgi:hypothetical protein